MDEKLLELLWQAAWPIVQGQIRHVISGFGFYLVWAGAIHSDQEGAFTQIAMGIIIYLGAVAWSALQKLIIPKLKGRVAELEKTAPWPKPY